MISNQKRFTQKEQTMKNKITAKHAGLGEVEFIIEAESREAAFAKFKQIVYSIRQWVVVSNEEVKA